MAVALKADGYGMLPLFGVSAQIIQQAKSIGVTVEQPTPGSFYVKLGPQTFGSIPVKGQAITLAKNGTLGPASKEALKYQFEQALKMAVQSGPIASVWQDPMPKVDLSSKSDAQVVLDKYSVEMGSKTPKFEAPISPPSGAPCALHAATALYQKVHGTSSGSVYVVVALLDDINIAARVMQGKLSLRVEGPGLQGSLGALGDVGFSHKVKDHYASVHFDIADDGLLLKTFGAVLGRLGFHKLKAQADLLKVKGMGK